MRRHRRGDGLRPSCAASSTGRSSRATIPAACSREAPRYAVEPRAARARRAARPQAGLAAPEELLGLLAAPERPEPARWIYSATTTSSARARCAGRGSTRPFCGFGPRSAGLAVSLDGPRPRGACLDPRPAARSRCSRRRVTSPARAAGRSRSPTASTSATPRSPRSPGSSPRRSRGWRAPCEALGIPVVSGNVSLYNETDGRAIHPTPVVGCVGLVDDVRAVPGAWREGDVVLLAGAPGSRSTAPSTRPGSSAGRRAAAAPDLAAEAALVALPLAGGAGVLSAAHDASDGGLAARSPSARSGAGSARTLDLDATRSPCFGEGGGHASSRARPGTSRGSGTTAYRCGEIGRVGGDRLIGWASPTCAMPASLRSREDAADVRRLRHPRARARRRPARALRPARAPAPRPGVGRHRRLGRRRPDGAARHGPRRAGLLARTSFAACRARPRSAHTRYSTTGGDELDERPAARPARLARARSRSATTATSSTRPSCARSCSRRGARLRSTSDTEVIAALIARRPAAARGGGRARRWRGSKAPTRSSSSPRGSLSAFRDPDGIRPLASDALDGDTCARLRVVRARPRSARSFVREVSAGRARRRRRATAAASMQARRARGRAARSASSSSSTSPGPTRSSPASSCTARGCGWASGSRARRPSRPTSSLPIPDSGTPAAIGFARASGIPYSEGLIKNRYVGRTFIQPDQALREHGIKTKFNPLDEVAGKRVVVVDDSIVRGTTTRKIVAMLFEAGATEVHVRVSSPPIVSPCFYGIDMATEGELVAAARTVDGGARAHRRDLARVPLARRPPGGDAPTGGRLLPRLPHARVSDAACPTSSSSGSSASSAPRGWGRVRSPNS